jgi:hypothetical protein
VPGQRVTFQTVGSNVAASVQERCITRFPRDDNFPEHEGWLEHDREWMMV